MAKKSKDLKSKDLYSPAVAVIPKEEPQPEPEPEPEVAVADSCPIERCRSQPANMEKHLAMHHPIELAALIIQISK